MGNVYMVRHGQTDLTLQHVFCGSLNPPLNELGMDTAKKAAVRLADVVFDRAFCSPLLRCQMTIQQFGVEYEIDEALRELNFGTYEGKPYAGLYAKTPGENDEYRKYWPNYTFPGGDNVPAYFRAAGETLRRYLRDYPQGNTLLVAHAGFMGAALGAATHGDPARLFEMRISPCDGMRVWLEGETVRFERV